MHPSRRMRTFLKPNSFSSQRVKRKEGNKQVNMAVLNSPPPHLGSSFRTPSNITRVMSSEDEAETDESLIALTTHFAQVQFRLKQIISAEPEHKEELLKDLEKFAFQGCGKPMLYDTAAAGENGSTETQRIVRLDLMEKLKTQLADIERCAQEATESEGVAGQSGGVAIQSGDQGGAEGGMVNVAEKQRIIIEELRKRFDFQFGDLERLSTEEVKRSVGKAVREVVDPIKSKAGYVTHLQSQIKDLERYIAFLQAKQLTLPCSLKEEEGEDGEEMSDSEDFTPHRKEGVARHLSYAGTEFDGILPGGRGRFTPVPRYRLSIAQLEGVECTIDATKCEWEKRDSFKRGFNQDAQGPDDLRYSLMMMKKTLAVMQVLTLCQCGGSLHCLPKYVADGRRKRYNLALHSLEMSMDKIAIVTTALTETGLSSESKVSLETDLHESVSMLLADSLRVLLEHGLLANGQPISLTGGCLPAWRDWGRGLKEGGGDCPAWRMFLYYYKMKNGDKYSSQTEQLLSTSFGLPPGTTSAKKTLLSSINKVKNTYRSCTHCSKDTKFRALICEGFNLRHLSEWLKILACNSSLGEDLYASSSFFTTTRLRPALSYLERLKDNPPCVAIALPQAYYQFEDAFLRA